MTRGEAFDKAWRLGIKGDFSFYQTHRYQLNYRAFWPALGRSSLAPQHTLKPCLLDDANLVDQNSKQITIILRSFRWSAGTDCHLSQQISALTLRSIGLGTAQLHLTFGFFFCFSSKVHCLLL